MKKILDINTEEYFQWYSNWINWKKVSADDIKNGIAGVTPYGLFSDWLSTKAIPLMEAIGKKVYYPLNAEHKDEITTDVWLEGVSIHSGYIEKVEKSEYNNYPGYVVTLNGKEYWLSTVDADDTFFEEKDLLIATLQYEGDYIYDGVTLRKEYDNNLYVDESE